jgi:hypothetical protein
MKIIYNDSDITKNSLYGAAVAAIDNYVSTL